VLPTDIPPEPEQDQTVIKEDKEYLADPDEQVIAANTNETDKQPVAGDEEMDLVP
jgi:hypothetical protein